MAWVRAPMAARAPPSSSYHFAPLLVGQNALAIERLWDMMFRMSKPYGTVGLAAVAMSGVDLALWDLKG